MKELIRQQANDSSTSRDFVFKALKCRREKLDLILSINSLEVGVRPPDSAVLIKLEPTMRPQKSLVMIRSKAQTHIEPVTDPIQDSTMACNPRTKL